MLNFLSSMEEYLWLGFVLLIFVAFAIPQFIDLWKSIHLFFKVLFSPNKEQIMGLIRLLMSMPEKLALHLVSSIVNHNVQHINYDDLIRRYTSVVDQPIGINDVKTGKVKTPFYVDFIAACCDVIVLKRISLQLASSIIETLKKENYSFDYIVSMSRSNVLVGLEVAKNLEKPFIVLGPTAGVDLERLVSINSKTTFRFILVDAIVSRGEEILNIANNVKLMGHELRYIFVAVDRCFHAKDRLREQSPFIHPLELYSICDYDDKKISAIINHDKLLNSNSM